MILQLKFSSDPSQQFVTQLGDTKYQFNARYNDRTGVWSMDMTDYVTQEPILQSIALVTGSDLLAPYDLKMGQIIVNDEDNSGIEAGPDDLGGRVQVYWLSPDE